MAQVGGDERSRTAIYLIEVGRSRPTPETLQLISERTGKPIEYFMPGSSTPAPPVVTREDDNVESLLRSGAYQQALDIVDRLLDGERRPDENWLRLRRAMSSCAVRLTWNWAESFRRT